MRSKYYYVSLVFLCLLVLTSTQTFAFDQDRTLNFPDFKRENFLDIQSYQPRKVLQDQWAATTNGLMLSGGSLDLDYLYLDTELRLRKPLNNKLYFWFNLKHHEFYASKPTQYLIGLDGQVLPLIALGVLGYSQYDKRTSDLGWSITLGEREYNYLRIQHLEQDVYFNEKNFDQDRYDNVPVVDSLEGFRQVGTNWRVRYQYQVDHKMRYYSAQDQDDFSHQSRSGMFMADYLPDEKTIFGVQINAFDTIKSKVATENNLKQYNQHQTLTYSSLKNYWAQSRENGEQFEIGLRWDDFANNFSDKILLKDSVHYNFSTAQFYGIYWWPWRNQMNWELGLYSGYAREARNYIEVLRKDREVFSFESKLRITLEITNAETLGLLQLSTTWNVDNFVNDLWDGGNLNFQTRF